ncbi:MAG: hypothetical protein AAF385_11490 [Pseudomonadota bacterium]
MGSVGEQAPARLLRLSSAQAYLGLNKSQFNKLVRPYLTEIRPSERVILFDVLELDGQAEVLRKRFGRPAKEIPEGKNSWDDKNACQVSNCEAESGMSTRKSKDTDDFAKALKRAITKPRRRTRSSGSQKFVAR